MKICNRCGIEKDTSEFNFKNKDKGTLRYCCRDCERLIRIEKRMKNPDLIREQEKVRQKRRSEKKNEYNKAWKKENRHCGKCGDLFVISRYSTKTQCDSCLTKEKEIIKHEKDINKFTKACKTCGTVFESKFKQYCSEECRPSFKLIDNKERTKECKTCGNKFVGKTRISQYCSNDCRKKAENRSKELQKGLRASKMKSNGKVDQDITIEKLIKRDGSKCYLCNCQTSFEDCEITKEGYFITGSKYPTIEHVLAIDNGGTHTWDNVKVACFECNTIKGTKDLKVFVC